MLTTMWHGGVMRRWPNLRLASPLLPIAARGSGPALTPQATDKRTPTGAPTARGPVTSTPVPQTHPDVLVSGTGVGGFVTFDTAAGTQVDVRVGVSYVSVANAKVTATTEQAGRSFDQVRQ